MPLIVVLTVSATVDGMELNACVAVAFAVSAVVIAVSDFDTAVFAVAIAVAALSADACAALTEIAALSAAALAVVFKSSRILSGSDVASVTLIFTVRLSVVRICWIRIVSLS